MSTAKMDVVLNKTDIAALLQIAPKKDPREYLNGICVQCVGSRVTMVATDGHAVLVVSRQRDDSAPEQVETIIPRHECEAIAQRRMDEFARVKVVGDCARTSQDLGAGGTVQRDWKPYDGKYPNILALIPHPDSLETGSEYLHPVQLSRLQAAMHTLQRTPKSKWEDVLPLSTFSTGRGKPAVVLDRYVTEAFGLIVPFRDPMTLSDAQGRVEAFSAAVGNDGRKSV